MRPQPQGAHSLINALTDAPITSRKTRVEVANSGKMEASEIFRKYPKTPVFYHSNYQLFVRIPAVPGTSNNRGLPVLHFILYLTFTASLYDGKYACFHMGVVRSVSRLIHGIARQMGASN